MHIIKLDATDSTNAHLKRMMSERAVEDFTVLVVGEQTQGRGQRGTVWESEAGKNLTFSILKEIDFLEIQQNFGLNMIVSRVLLKVLQTWQIPDVSIKWPNDILSARKKICGILIENVLQSGNSFRSVIGIGLNVNQTEFQIEYQASSLKLLTGMHYEVDEILYSILETLRIEFETFKKTPISVYQREYEELLFRKDKPSTFQTSEGKRIMGFIRGVNPEGKLQVELEDERTVWFDFKEVRLLY